MKLVFLLEEPSMKALLKELLPRILPEDIQFQLVSHSGKRDLEKSIPRKLRGWNEPGDIRFIILHDQDNKDCVKLKKDLISRCSGATTRPILIRIACQELESWYFGDLPALEKAYGKSKLRKLVNQSKYRDPDRIPDPKETLYKLLPEHQQIEGARKIAPHMNINQNRSTSFQVFIKGIRELIERNV